MKGRWVHPTTHRIVKFFPMMAPEKGDIMLVNDERCKVKKVVGRRMDNEGGYVIDGIKVVPYP